MAEEEGTRVTADTQDDLRHLEKKVLHSEDESVSSIESSKYLSCNFGTELSSAEVPTESASAVTVNVSGNKNNVFIGCNITQEDNVESRRPHLSKKATHISRQKENGLPQSKVILESSSESPKAQLPTRGHTFNGSPETEGTAAAQDQKEDLSTKLDDAYAQVDNIESRHTGTQEENIQLKRENELLKRKHAALNKTLKNILEQSEEQENVYSDNFKRVRWRLFLLPEMTSEQDFTIDKNSKSDVYIALANTLFFILLIILLFMFFLVLWLSFSPPMFFIDGILQGPFHVLLSFLILITCFYVPNSSSCPDTNVYSSNVSCEPYKELSTSCPAFQNYTIIIELPYGGRVYLSAVFGSPQLSIVS